MELLLYVSILVLAAVPCCQAGQMAAWWTSIGPQIMMQNSTTGLLRYSACNSRKTPSYSYDDSSEFSTSLLPRNGTALAGVGWWTNTQTIASIFYQDANNDLVNLYATCDMETGKFITNGTYVISGNAPSVNTNTGLAAVLLGSTSGYRVYFHDNNSLVNEIAYTTDEGWNWKDVVSNDPQGSFAIAASFLNSSNITVVSARDAQNIEAMQWNIDKSWHISTFPEPLNGPDPITNFDSASSISVNTTVPSGDDGVLPSLPGWTSQTTSLGFSIDSNSATRSAWYIGSDAALHQVSSDPAAQGGDWLVQATPQAGSQAWPPADLAYSPLAVAAGSSSSVYVYYLVNGLVTQVSFSSGVWQDAAALPIPSPAASTSTSPSTPASSTPASTSTGAASSSGSGLSTGAQAGIGVGVAVVALAAIGAAAAFLLARRRARLASGPQQAAGYSAVAGGAVPGYAGMPGEPKADPYSSAYAAAGGPGTPPSQQPSPAPPYGAQGTWQPNQNQNQGYVVAQHPGVGQEVGQLTELSGTPRPLFELADQSYTAELPTGWEEGGGRY